MPPITKLWLCALKDGQATDSPAFTQLLSGILELCSSYTNPDAEESRPMHVMYQDIDNPSQLLMITGYQSQELNTQADKVYAEKYLPRMFEMVQHVWLKQVDVDVRSMPLDGEKVVVTYGQNPLEWKNAKGVGAWDVWLKTRQAKENENGARGMTKEDEDKAVWVQVLGWDDSKDDDVKPAVGERFRLRKIMGI